MARFRFFAAAATTGLKGREKMIVVNPQTVTNRELAALAMQAKGRIQDQQALSALDGRSLRRCL